MNSKVKFKEKILSFLMLTLFFASFYIRGVNLVWTIGNIPACFKYRYVFCFIFMVIMLSYKAFENFHDGIKIWNVLLACFIYGLFCVIMIVFNISYITEGILMLELLFIALLGVLMILAKLCYMDRDRQNNSDKNKRYEVKFIFVLIIIVGLVDIIIDDKISMYKIFRYADSVRQDKYEEGVSFYEGAIKTIKKNDDSVYRIEGVKRFRANDGLIFDFNGITLSSSTFSKEQYIFLTHFGYSQQHVLISSDTGNTNTSRMLLGVKYVIQNIRRRG